MFYVRDWRSVVGGDFFFWFLGFCLFVCCFGLVFFCFLTLLSGYPELKDALR